MKPTISETDYKTLRELIINHANGSGKNLGREIDQALIVEEKEMDERTVRLNSFVEVKAASSSQSIKMQIVMPDCASLKERRISVFAPISVALIGYRESETVCWKTPDGDTHIKIIKVING